MVRWVGWREEFSALQSRLSQILGRFFMLTLAYLVSISFAFDFHEPGVIFRDLPHLLDWYRPMPELKEAGVGIMAVSITGALAACRELLSKPSADAWERSIKRFIMGMLSIYVFLIAIFYSVYKDFPSVPTIADDVVTYITCISTAMFFSFGTEALLPFLEERTK